MGKGTGIKYICSEQCYLGKWQNWERKHIYDTERLPNSQVILSCARSGREERSSGSELEFCCQGRDKKNEEWKTVNNRGRSYQIRERVEQTVRREL